MPKLNALKAEDVVVKIGPYICTGFAEPEETILSPITLTVPRDSASCHTLIEELQVGDWKPFSGFDIPCEARVVEARATETRGVVVFKLERRHVRL